MVPVTGRTAVYALLGHPVAHSASPALHNGWFAALGVDAVYVALEIDPSLGARVVDALRVLPLAGCNLTIPFKQDVVPSLDALDGLAAAAGVVNTIVREGARLVGHNTDGDGFLDGLREIGRGDVRGAKAVVLGAGGAGRAVAAALVREGADVVVLNRTPSRAQAAVDAIRGLRDGARPVADALTPERFAAHVVDADLVVQATSGSGAGAVAALGVDEVPEAALWVDLNYWMDAPPLWSALGARGVARQDGSAMLRRQAARAFRLWTGLDPEPVRARDRLG